MAYDSFRSTHEKKARELVLRALNDVQFKTQLQTNPRAVLNKQQLTDNDRQAIQSILSTVNRIEFEIKCVAEGLHSKAIDW